MEIYERSFSAPRASFNQSIFSSLRDAARTALSGDAFTSRFVINRSGPEQFECDIGIVENIDRAPSTQPDDIFRFEKRKTENTEKFTAVLIVPTGIGAEIGGHAGDAMAVSRLIGAACDQLVTHPNVVNASDINELPEDALYVEGSILTRLLMGTVGLQPVRSNRTIVVIDNNENETFTNAAINAVNAARATYGFICPKIIRLEPPLIMRSKYQASGRASGEIFGFERVLDVLLKERENYDAVAISSTIQVPLNYHQDYFDMDGKMINPWGGVEAMLTHAISSLLDVPSAHSPMFESELIANMDPGIVEPRMAAEAISLTFLQCILKGLHRSPRIVTDPIHISAPGIVSAADVSCLVIPDGCLGLPTIAALHQGIPVIAVRENKNLMQNDLSKLPWAAGQFHVVENYWEAVGVMTAIRAGLDPSSVRRPVGYVDVETTGTPIVPTTRKDRQKTT